MHMLAQASMLLDMLNWLFKLDANRTVLFTTFMMQYDGSRFKVESWVMSTNQITLLNFCLPAHCLLLFQALGCLFYEMCSLKPAFDANNLISLFYKIVKGEYDVSIINFCLVYILITERYLKAMIFYNVLKTCCVGDLQRKVSHYWHYDLMVIVVFHLSLLKIVAHAHCQSKHLYFTYTYISLLYM